MKKNGNDGKTHCIRGHSLEGENVYVNLSRPARPFRQCRACIRLRVAESVAVKPGVDLSPKQLARMRDAHADGVSVDLLVGRFGVCRDTVLAAVKS